MTEEQLFTEWARELSIQNRELKDEGEEPLTAAEFFQCRAEDALVARGRREELRIERWHGTYNAAVSGILANDAERNEHEVHDWAVMSANKAHGPLVKP